METGKRYYVVFSQAGYSYETNIRLAGFFALHAKMEVLNASTAIMSHYLGIARTGLALTISYTIANDGNDELLAAIMKGY